jgi:integrase
MRKKTQKLPTVLTKEQVANIISACENLKHRLILMTTYAAGLRASEVASLRTIGVTSCFMNKA